jgi:hypothetical protein
MNQTRRIALALLTVVAAACRSQAPQAGCSNPVLLSRGAPVTASMMKNVEAVTDGNPDARWNSEGFPPQWVEIDLGADVVVHHVSVIPEQTPPGHTEHRISGTSDGRQTRQLGVLRGNTASGEAVVLTVSDEVGRGIRKVKVETVETPRSWVAWREIEVYGCRIEQMK